MAERPSVAIGPFDTAGCASALAAGLRTAGAHVELALVSEHEYGYGRAPALSRANRLLLAARLPWRHSIAHYQFGRTWLPLQVDAVWARARGCTLAVSFYGDDCRQYGVARTLYPARGRVGDPARDAAVRRRLRRLSRLCHAAIVGDLELAAYVLPFFRRVYVSPLPVAETEAPVRRDRRAGAPLIVVHAPSDPQVKGTGRIEAAVREAARHAPLELRVLHGLPHSAVLDALGEADLAVDQLNSVTTGIFALEAMHAGLPVLSELDAKAIAPFQSAAPIVPVTAASLADALRALARDEPRRQRLAAAGPPYVRRLHLAPAAARAALLVYEHSRRGPEGLFEATADGVVALAGEERELRSAFAAATAS